MKFRVVGFCCKLSCDESGFIWDFIVGFLVENMIKDRFIVEYFVEIEF